MTLCTPNTLTKPVPSCTQYLELGTITALSANLTIYIHDLTTNRTDAITALSDGAGLVTVDLTDFEGSSSHTYAFWITEQGDNIEDKLTLTVGAGSGETFTLRFTDVFEGDDSMAVTSQTLELV